MSGSPRRLTSTSAVCYRIREEAAARSVSLREIARRSNMSRTRLQDIANNRGGNVTMDTLIAIADALGVPITALIEIAPDKPLAQEAAS